MERSLTAEDGDRIEDVSGTPRDPVMDVLGIMPGRVITFTRSEAVADADWYNCDHYKQVRQPLDIGPTLYVKIVAQSIGRQTELRWPQ